ncbi:MAG: D-glycero-beta-D-manno-heptose 1,7-bisphosphate 7-phosphatase [Desulfobacteraceae bacterium]|nr:D-glycero-beta-D-manno-heptose 1,7-bisphosphate 7-phosphatase [Pseudomonadota bacterium]MBU4463824.1 D-glycero-beta-D-manno-heptose 1,7-bisphosphate 7-phosphatase [Pseudomonadota bacterium]MCG2755626.1 D-glycero-beta-D-manno-heptose 1,7-bisphosphate 7-phosphatase [Desulfobacteraceae bacterium]
MKQRVVFLDRDGVINRDSPDYIKSWEEFEFLPGSIEAIRLLNLNGFATIIITNQSAINRNMISKQGLEHIHALMKKAIKSGGGEIKDIFFCPHTPEEGCDCRKPKPGLIYQAQKKYQIDLPASIMVGDDAKDIECASRAGCGLSVLVKSENFLNTERLLSEKKISPDYTALDLYDAANWISSHFL